MAIVYRSVKGSALTDEEHDANWAEVDAKPASNPFGITGANPITNMVYLSQAAYDALPTRSATTLYITTP